MTAHFRMQRKYRHTLTTFLLIGIFSPTFANGATSSTFASRISDAWNRTTDRVFCTLLPTVCITPVPPVITTIVRYESAPTTTTSEQAPDAIEPTSSSATPISVKPPTQAVLGVSTYPTVAITPSTTGRILTVEDVVALIRTHTPSSGSFVSGGVSLVQGSRYDDSRLASDVSQLQSGTLSSPLTVTSNATSTFAGVIAPNSIYLGSIAPANTTNLLYNNNSVLYWNGSPITGGSDSWTSGGSDVFRLTGNVGIGTTTPTERLSVQGGFDVLTSRGSYMYLKNRGDFDGFRVDLTGGDVGYADTYMSLDSEEGFFIHLNQEIGTTFQASSDYFGFTGSNSSFSVTGGEITAESSTFMFRQYGGGQPQFLIDSEGNVGVGTSTPSRLLTVAASAAPAYAEITSNTSHAGLFLKSAARNWHVFSEGTTGLFSIKDEVSGENRLSISAGGNVGIGTLDPQAKLEVGGGVLIDGPLDIFDEDGDDLFHVDQADKYLSFLGNVGIGTTDPNYKLEVNGTSFFSDDVYLSTHARFVDADNDGGKFYIAAVDGSASFGSGAFVVTSSGDVGIGTADPQVALDVGSEFSRGRLFVSPEDSYISLGLATGIDGEVEGLSVSNSSESALVKIGSTGYSGNSTLLTVDDEARKFTFENGNVGIGTTSPGAQLHIHIPDDPGNSPLKISDSSTGSIFQITGVSDGWPYINSTSPNGNWQSGIIEDLGADSFALNAEGLPLTLNVDYVEAMRITSNGNVGIGTSSPQRLLHVYRNSDGPPVRFEDSNGYCEINPTNTTWTCTSDERLKRDVVSINASLSLDKVLQLRPVTFRWNTESNAEARRLGLIAQEVERIYPEFVTTDDRGFKSVSYGSLAPVLISAVQAINDRILSIEQQLAEIRDNRTSSLSNVITAIAGVFTKVRVSDGFEMRDADTGQYFCVRIRSSEFVKTRGDCSNVAGVNEDEPTIEPTPAPTATSTATTTESVTETEQLSEDASDVSTNDTPQPDDVSPETQSDVSDSTETPTATDSE